MATYYAYSGDENWWAGILRECEAGSAHDDWFNQTFRYRMIADASFNFERETDAVMFKLMWM